MYTMHRVPSQMRALAAGCAKALWNENRDCEGRRSSEVRQAENR